MRIGLKMQKRKGQNEVTSRPHGFALWICLADLPCASTLPDVSQLCAERVPSACRACAQRAALIWCARRLLRADGQEFAADAGHATNPAQTDTQTRGTQAQANPRSQQTPRRQTRGRAEQRHAQQRHADRHADARCSRRFLLRASGSWVMFVR